MSRGSAPHSSVGAIEVRTLLIAFLTIVHDPFPARSRVPKVWEKCTMRLCSFLLLEFCLLIAFVPPTGAQESSEAAKVRALEHKWADSYKQRQIDLLSTLLADDFVITVEDGTTYSKIGYISHSADSSVRVDVAELSDLKIHMHGNTAVVTGGYHEKGVSAGKPYEYHDRLTDVWAKSGGAWQVIASHYSIPSR
jgi:ketosteroid isomerase-like protein